jgi:hypothetical protein
MCHIDDIRMILPESVATASSFFLHKLGHAITLVLSEGILSVSGAVAMAAGDTNVIVL